MSFEIPRRILVGFCEREEARDALALASVFSRYTDTGPIIAVALRYDPVPRVPATGYDEAIAFHFDALFETAAEALGTREFERRALLDRSPAHALAVAAESEQADLIVLGSSHRGRFTRAYPGAVPSHVLRSAPCTVAVAPPGYASRPELGIDPIGVGYDGGPESVEALDWAAAMAAETGCGLRLIGALEPDWLPVTLGEMEHLELDLALHNEWQQSFRRARERLPEGVVAATVQVRGDPVDVLTQQARDLGLLVVGSRAYGPLRRTLLGSVSESLLQRPVCPLVVTPRP